MTKTLQDLEDCFGDKHFAATFRSQVKSRTQGAGESLQDFAMGIERLAHRSYPTLPAEHIRRAAGKAFADGVEDHEIKVALMIGGKKTVNEALRQALEIQALLVAAISHKTSNKTVWGSRWPPSYKET
jgi:hypothetical protein